MRIVDTKGQPCPAPLVATKRALRETPEGSSFRLLIDSQTSFNNVRRFLKDNDTRFEISEANGEWTLEITRGGGDVSHARAEDYCDIPIPHFHRGDFIVVISSDRMGEGDEELGRLLMSNFIKAIKDLDILPGKMVFYNKGVTIVTTDSPDITHLRDLERMGVEILLCATCVDYYGLNESYGAGILSNMFTIAEVMAGAGNILKP